MLKGFVSPVQAQDASAIPSLSAQLEPVAFLASVAAVSVTTVFVANRIARRNKPAAMLFLTAINVAYGAIVMHNYKVAGCLR